MQDFGRKNIVYARISSIFRAKDCCSREDANVNSEGTHPKGLNRLKPKGEGACRMYDSKGPSYYKLLNFEN